MQFLDLHLFQFLRRFDHQHLPLDLFLSHYFRSNTALGAKDRRFLSETIYGMTRWRGLLDHLAGDAASWEKRYAIYKGFQPTAYLYVNAIPPHIRVSFPPFLFELILSQYGEEKTMALCQILNTQAPLTVRVNTLKTTRRELFTRLEGKYDVTPTEVSPLGLSFKKRVPFCDMAEFREGLFEVQDEGSQLVALLVNPKSGEHILDYCAGSGGKTLAFAAATGQKGQLYLHDVRVRALEQAKKRLARAGISNAQCLSAHHTSLPTLKGKMDCVLVDAPCSGTGTLRRNPDMKWKFSPELLERLIKEQREIFKSALKYVKPSGRIIYATCSLLAQENEHQVKHFLSQFPLELIQEPFVSLPAFGGMDGFFAVSMRLK